jgi:hypothetical protein
MLLLAVSSGPLNAQNKSGDKKASVPNLTAAYNAYLNRLRHKVLNNWNVPDGKNQVVVQAAIAVDGTLGEISAVSTPGNEAAEQAATAALSLAQPLEALPAQSPPVRLVLTFESTADPHGDSTSNLSSKLEPLKAAASNP